MTRKCKHCPEEIPGYSKSETVYHKKKYCSFDCMVKHGIEKARTDPYKPVKSKPSKDKQATLAHQLEITQKIFNKFIRLLDVSKSCISCGKNECGGSVHAGHFRSVGSAPEMRFDPRNCYAQGAGCNLGAIRRAKNAKKSSETIAQEYDRRLRDRYNDKLVDWVKGPHPASHWTAEELKELRVIYNAEIRRLEKGRKPSRNWRSLCYTQKSLVASVNQVCDN